MVNLGIPNNDALNIILLLAKFHIYKSKMINVLSAFEDEFLMYCNKAERIHAISNHIRFKKWILIIT